MNNREDTKQITESYSKNVRPKKEEYIRTHLSKLHTYCIKRGTLYGAWIIIPHIGQCGTQIYADKKPDIETFIQAILNCED